MTLRISFTLLSPSFFLSSSPLSLSPSLLSLSLSLSLSPSSPLFLSLSPSISLRPPPFVFFVFLLIFPVVILYYSATLLNVIVNYMCLSLQTMLRY